MKTVTIEHQNNRFEAHFPFCMATKDWIKSLRFANQKFSFDFDKKVWWTASQELAEYALKLQENDYQDFETLPELPILEGETRFPEGVEPYPYQVEGVLFMAQRKAVLLADHMGLGKSLQSIGVANLIEPKRILVICPNSLRLNWRNEFLKFSTQVRRIQVVNDAKEAIRGELVILNYEKVAKMKPAIDAVQWDLMIVDEAHRLKNKDAKVTQSILGVKLKTGTIPAIPASRKIFLTGTPILNRPSEAFTLCQACDPTGLGASWWNYVHKYCGAFRTRFGLDVSGASNLEELRIKMRNFMLRRTKAEVLKQLPPKREQVIVLQPDAMQTAAIEAEKMALSEKVDWKDLDLADPKMSLAINQIAEYRKATALAKLPSCYDIFDDDLESGKLVVMAHHRDVCEAIFEKYKDCAVLVHGGIDADERQRAVDTFQNDPNCKLFVGSILAAGVGITLTAASQLCFVESDWRPGMMEQAADRIHRIGQENSVLIKHIVLDGSIDAWMVNKLISKQRIISKVI